MPTRLSDSKSTYLKMAADSPIDWHPWAAEAFDRARREDKPILLDIGAAWCHWCHVMDHGTYEDAGIVKALNEGFVCIKVDRDERPDVDIRYQRVVGALTGSGGWPLTAFLDPDGRVFFGGTYFPPDDAHGRPGMRTVLTEISRLWREERERVTTSADHIQNAIRQQAAQSSKGPLEPEALPRILKQLVAAHDHKFGGFGAAPKFPHTGAILLSLVLHQRTGDTQARTIAERTLSKMAAGGIHDRVAGGFHRYSVDAHWTVPHFEKMSYDNAELLRVYAYAHAITGNEEHREVAQGIMRWATEVCGDETLGGFGGSQDADISAQDDGDHFTWTLDELRDAIHTTPGTAKDLDDATLFEIARRRFGVEERGDMHHDTARNVLEAEISHTEVAKETGLDEAAVQRAEKEILHRLRIAREKRPQPIVDPVRYTDWNAMYASAFVEAGALFDDEAAVRLAVRTLDRMYAEAWDAERGWMHRPREASGEIVAGLLDDQAWAGLANMDAYRLFGSPSDRGPSHDPEQGGGQRFLERARHTAGLLLSHWHAESGAFTDTAEWLRERAHAAPLQDAAEPQLDQPAPGGNPIAAIFLMRLGRATDEERYVEAAREALAAGAEQAKRAGIFAATWHLALDELLHEPPRVVVLGAADDPETNELLRVARRTPRTGMIVQQVEPGDTQNAPAFLRDVIGNEDLVKTGPQALVCHGDHCDALLSDPDELVRRLERKMPSGVK